jgi:HlyD family secretion protein
VARGARDVETGDRQDGGSTPPEADGRVAAPIAPPPEAPTPQRPEHESNGAARPDALELEEREADQAQRQRVRRRWLMRMGVLAALIVGVSLFLNWWSGRPILVEVVPPERRAVMETVAASGQVSGRRESVVGSPVQGVVAELCVDEGDVVRRGQPLARIQNNVAQAQVRQAEQALRTARAQLVQTEAGARPSELQASRAQVQQAEATVGQREAQVAQARAAVTQAEARRELAQKNLERNRYLLREGAIARQSVDQAEMEYRAAVAEVASAREGVATAQANLAAARAAVAAARAQSRTLEEGPRPEAVLVARLRVREAEAALQVAREQARSAIARAPFAGTVTKIITERGGPVGTNGILRLVQTGRPEIPVDVDESNLANLRVGQPAVITSSTFRDARLEARVTRISPQVDPARGTVEVRLVPSRSVSWLRPGETVNVNIITAPSAPRLVIPRSAIRREGDRTVVLLVKNGRAVAQPVTLGPVEGDLVPVLQGLTPTDLVVRQADQVTPGARVQAR